MQVQHSKLNIIPLTPEIAVETGVMKQPGISVVDTIIAASALSVGALVVTNDAHFSAMGIEMSKYPG
jgi:predicted nucleic acid-binding protein